MCKIICHSLFYYMIMIRNKSINVLIVFSIKFTIKHFFVFTKTVFFHELILFNCRLTISSAFLEKSLMTICFSVWLVWAPFLNVSIEGLLLRPIMWVWKRGTSHYDDTVCQLVTLRSAQTVGLLFQEVLSDASIHHTFNLMDKSIFSNTKERF